MHEYFEIAYALASERLTLFTGTGFSKAVTEEKIPSWQELLEKICDENGIDEQVKSTLFPNQGTNPLSLEEAAQLISMKLSEKNESIHEVIAKEIQNHDLENVPPKLADFFKKRSFRVITTNYDTLSEKLAGADSQSIVPGLPIPRSKSRVKVYHVHGAIDHPKRMTVTSQDYYDFIYNETYFAQKLSTILHENTIVILGYSLADANLKAILNRYKGYLSDNTAVGNVFFISRKPVPIPVSDFYASCYGIRVIDETSIEDFFRNVANQIPNADEIKDRSTKNLMKVLSKEASFTDNFLHIDNSFYEIISAIGAIGKGLTEKSVVTLFGDIIRKKQAFCHEKGAWVQYEQLAGWLAYLGTLIDIKGTPVEEDFLNAVKFSMEGMSKSRVLGYSWHAYQRWNDRWKFIKSSNRTLIKDYIENESSDPDVIELVSRG